MIGISEGIVLADRYRLTRRQSERETGASWIAVDLETGSDVWVQFADHGGLAQAADTIRGLISNSTSSVAAALPSVLDTGELRMIVDSRAIAAVRGGAEAYATHVEIVIEFVVIKPLAGRGLPAKIQRKALPPAEALAIAATLAGALDAALPAGGSHGWLGSWSVWLVRRGGCVLDLALGLAFPDGSVIELEQQVTGYFAPERFAVAGAAATGGAAGTAVGSGSKATEAADVYALGWMVYEMLVGHAELVAEYERLVAGAGAVTTVELLALWRARARVHLTELVEADSALAVLVLACLAENAAARPNLAAFGERARGAAKGLAGVAPLVVPVARTRAAAVAEVAAVAAAAAAVEGAEVAEAAEAGIAAAEVAAAAAVVGAGVLAGEALAAEGVSGAGTGIETGSGIEAGSGIAEAGQAAEFSEVAEVADVSDTSTEASGVASGASSLSEEAAAGAVVAEAETVVLAAAARAETLGVAAFGAEGLAGSSNSAGAGSSVSSSAEREKEVERLSHRARLATIGGTAAAVVALGVGVAVGYSIGHSGNSTTLTAVGTNAAGPIPSASSSAVAAPAPTVTVTVTVTVTEAGAASPSASPSASASSSASSAASGSASAAAGASSSPSTVSSPALPAPSSSGEAISELTQEIQYLQGSGQISGSTAGQLTTAVGTLKSSLGTHSSSSSLSSLTSLIRSLKNSGHLSGNAEVTLESILGYFYAQSGS
ncbi:hypothetical protein [Actinospica robiniae]|uniref:hypothetical protein n=1 Tax=Actinospica robiniae TaxID=304901 RepID=UPI0004234AA9|nr:hypothetical protein [Actinospica robiniae]